MLINCSSWTTKSAETNADQQQHHQQQVTVTTQNASTHGASTATYGHYGVHMTNVPYTTHPTGLIRQNSLCSPTPEQTVFPPHCPHNGVIVYPSLINRDYSVESPPEYEKDCSKAPWRFAYRKVCILSIALFSILLVAMFVEFWYFSRLHPIDSQLNCVQCSRLKLSADPLDDYSSGLNIFTKQGVLYCCARNHSQQQQIFDALLEDKMRQMRASMPSVPQARVSQRPHAEKQHSNDTSAPSVQNLWAAQLQLKSAPRDAGVNEFKVIRDWIRPHGHGQLTFIRRGIQYDATRGTLVILRSGLYKLYSHLVFKGPMQEQTQHRPKVYTQKLLRESPFNRGHPEVLFQDMEMVGCDDPIQAIPCHTSNLMGQAYLKQGDKIYLIAMPAHLLQETFSYFGLFRISD